MKRTFELLVFSSTASDAAAPAISGDTTSGARQGVKWQEKEAALKALATKFNLKLHSEADLVGPTADTVACDVEWPINKIGRDSIVMLAGGPTVEQLKSAITTLKQRGNDVIVVVDALKDLPSLLATLYEVNEDSVELAVYGGLEALLHAEHLMVYRYAKADQTATIAVFADIDEDDPLVLTMVRDGEPFKGCESFPGGFLNIHLENLSECGARELMEECFLNPKPTGAHDRFTYRVKDSDLLLIDVRSDPYRDERGHVVDHGFAWFIPKAAQAEVMSKLSAGTDAKPGSCRFVRASELMKRELAFDHKKLFEAALARLKGNKN